MIIIGIISLSTIVILRIGYLMRYLLCVASTHDYSTAQYPSN